MEFPASHTVLIPGLGAREGTRGSPEVCALGLGSQEGLLGEGESELNPRTKEEGWGWRDMLLAVVGTALPRPVWVPGKGECGWGEMRPGSEEKGDWSPA